MLNCPNKKWSDNMILSVEIILKNYFYSVVLDTTTIFKKIKSIRITN